MEAVLFLHLLWCGWVLLGWTVTRCRPLLRTLHIASLIYAIVRTYTTNVFMPQGHIGKRKDGARSSSFDAALANVDDGSHQFFRRELIAEQPPDLSGRKRVVVVPPEGLGCGCHRRARLRSPAT